MSNTIEAHACALDARPALDASPARTVPCGNPDASPARTYLFGIPDQDEQFFAARVKHAERKRVRQLLAALREIHSVRVAEGVNPACKRLAYSLHVNWHTLRRNYYDYTGGVQKCDQWFNPGDWRTILNWSRVRAEKVNLPLAFLEFWRGLGEKNQRKWKPAYDELMQIIRTRLDFSGRAYKKIPGFEQWPAIDPVLGHPPGMSYANLMNYKSDPYDTSLARHGRVKGSELRLPVLKTRISLRFGQFVEFDDHDFNQKPMFQKKPMRPSGFMAIEVLSACPALFAIKPNLWDFEEQVRLTLTEREFMWFVIAWLTTVGVRRDDVGTTFITERAKAVIKGEFKTRLLEIVPNLKIYAGSIPETHARAPHAGQFDGRGRGNFRTKALVESFFNLVDNQTASLAGQMGKDRDHSPAQLHGQEKYTREIIHAAIQRSIAPESFQFPFLTFHQWRLLALDIVERIKAARDHQCEGWKTLGFERVQWRPGPESQNWFEVDEFKRLPDVERALIQARMDTDTSLTRPLKLSRGEVFNHFRHELKPVSLIHIPELVGRENALNAGRKPLRVAKGLFSFDCEEIEPDTLEFYARDQSPSAAFLPNDGEYICFVNPCHPQHLIACDDHLRVVAVCPRYERAHDDASLHQTLGQQQSYEAAARVRLNLRHDDDARRNRAMREHNQRVLDQHGPRNAELGPTHVGDCTSDILAKDDAPAPTAPADDWK